MGKKNLLLIALYYPPLMCAASLRTSKYANRLVEKYNVRVLTLSNPEDTGLGVDESIEDGEGVEVHRAFSPELPFLLRPFLGKGGKARHSEGRRAYYWLLPGRHYLWAPFALAKAVPLALKSDIVYTPYPPMVNMCIGLMLKLLFRRKWVVALHDSWYSVVKEYQPTPVHAFLIKLREKLFLKLCDRIGVTSPQIKEDVKKLHGLSEEKFFDMPQAVDIGFFNSVKPAKMPFTAITYAGAISDDQDVSPLLRALNELGDENKLSSKKLKFVLAGPRNEAMLEKYRALDKHGFLEYVGPKPFKESVALLKGSELLFVALAGKDSLRYAVPSKLFDYFAAGRPVIGCFPHGEAEKVVERSGAGETVVPSDVRGLKNIIISLLGDKKKREIYAKRALKEAEKYGLENINKVFERIF